MNRITFRIAITLLTFVVGVAAVSLWFFFRRNVAEKKIEPTKIEEPVVKNEDEQAQEEMPKVKWLYISDPIKWQEEIFTQEASIVIFYENGEWGKFTPSIKKEGEFLEIGVAEGFSAEVGRWEEKANGLIIITIERRRCYLCAGTKRKTMPIVEHWNIKGILGQEKKILLSPNEKYKLLSKDRVLEADRVLFEPLWMKTDNSPMGEDY